ncbi:hypothetical protein P8452_19297 [Trifolium repens]|nr:hypothetical protein P8452_19297 [Trifolium repens]
MKFLYVVFFIWVTNLLSLSLLQAPLPNLSFKFKFQISNSLQSLLWSLYCIHTLSLFSFVRFSHSSPTGFTSITIYRAHDCNLCSKGNHSKFIFIFGFFWECYNLIDEAEHMTAIYAAKVTLQNSFSFSDSRYIIFLFLQSMYLKDKANDTSFGFYAKVW